MTAVEMPVVGKSFYAFCKKCDTDRYQTVLALPTETSAKLQCEVCKAKSTWKVPKAKAAKGTTAPRGAAAKAKATAEAARSAAHAAEYENFSNSLEKTPAVTYTMKGQFAKDAKINHPTFGLGFVRSSQSDKIEVVFPNEVRSLVHNRR